MPTIERHERTDKAIRMLQTRLRPSIVALQTGLSAPQVRALYKELHGEPPNSGPWPEPDGVVKTRRRLAEAAFLMQLYRRLGVNVEREIDIDALLSAHRLYTQGLQTLGPQLTINEGWVLARALRSATARLLTCPKCHIEYLEVDSQRLVPRCPFC